MAVSRKLEDPTIKQPSLEELIMKGGSSGAKEVLSSVEEDDLKRVQLRIPQPKLDQIDKMVSRRPGKLSRHTWIMEAIEEKLERDGQS